MLLLLRDVELSQVPSSLVTGAFVRHDSLSNPTSSADPGSVGVVVDAPYLDPAARSDSPLSTREQREFSAWVRSYRSMLLWEPHPLSRTDAVGCSRRGDRDGVKVLEVVRGPVFEAGVASDGVVEAFDPLDDRRGELLAAGPGATWTRRSRCIVDQNGSISARVDAQGDPAHRCQQPAVRSRSWHESGQQVTSKAG